MYAGVVTRRMRTQTSYQPGLEDWSFQVLLPTVAYLMLALSALAAPSHGRSALFSAGAGALLLLFIGIHNAWDAIVYRVFVNMRNAGD